MEAARVGDAAVGSRRAGAGGRGAGAASVPVQVCGHVRRPDRAAVQERPSGLGRQVHHRLPPGRRGGDGDRRGPAPGHVRPAGPARPVRPGLPAGQPGPLPLRRVLRAQRARQRRRPQLAADRPRRHLPGGPAQRLVLAAGVGRLPVRVRSGAGADHRAGGRRAGRPVRGASGDPPRRQGRGVPGGGPALRRPGRHQAGAPAHQRHPAGPGRTRPAPPRGRHAGPVRAARCDEPQGRPVHAGGQPVPGAGTPRRRRADHLGGAGEGRRPGRLAGRGADRGARAGRPGRRRARAGLRAAGPDAEQRHRRPGRLLPAGRPGDGRRPRHARHQGLHRRLRAARAGARADVRAGRGGRGGPVRPGRDGAAPGHGLPAAARLRRAARGPLVGHPGARAGRGGDRGRRRGPGRARAGGSPSCSARTRRWSACSCCPVP